MTNKINKDRIKELYVGQAFKNYKELCKFLNMKIMSGSSKVSQFKELDRYCKLDRDGYRIIISDIYEEVKEKIDGRKGNINGATSIKEITPLLVKEWNYEKNTIKIDNVLRTNNKDYYWWKCLNCSYDIYSTTKRRFRHGTALLDENITCPYCTSSKYSKLIYKSLNLSNITFKNEYMFDDLIGIGGRKLRFDYALVINNELKCLIEYDGEYHNICESTMNHDKIKDEYCIKNNIPLLRIHYTEKDKLHRKLLVFLNEIGIEFNKDYLNKQIEIEIQNEREYLENLKLEKEKILKRLAEIDNILSTEEDLF